MTDQTSYIVLTTPGNPEKLLEFWKFPPGPWKTPGKTDNFLEHLENSWNFVEKISSVFLNLQKNLSYGCIFCILCRLDFSWFYCSRNYLLSFCFAEREFRVGLWKNKFFTLEKAWKTPLILLFLVSEHHEVKRQWIAPRTFILVP